MKHHISPCPRCSCQHMSTHITVQLCLLTWIEGWLTRCGPCTIDLILIVILGWTLVPGRHGNHCYCYSQYLSSTSPVPADAGPCPATRTQGGGSRAAESLPTITETRCSCSRTTLLLLYPSRKPRRRAHKSCPKCSSQCVGRTCVPVRENARTHAHTHMQRRTATMDTLECRSRGT